MECNLTIYKEKLITSNPSRMRDLLREQSQRYIVSVLMNHHQDYGGWY